MQSIALKMIAQKMQFFSLLILLWTPNCYSTSEIKTPQIPDLNDENQLLLYKQAELALKNDKESQFQELFKQLKTHPLADYLYRDWLIKQLSRTPNSSKLEQQIVAFLKKNHNQVVSRKLRSNWLNFLADSNRHQQFKQYYVFQQSIKLKCHYLWLKLLDGDQVTDTEAKIASLWLTGKSLPKHCDPLISLSLRNGILSQQLIWQRMLLAAQNKQFQLLRYLNRMLTSDKQLAGQWLEKISRTPAKLKQNLPKKIEDTLAKDIILAGLTRLAWQKPHDAIRLWKEYHPRLDLSLHQKQQLQRAIGLALAISHSNDAQYWLLTIQQLEDSSVKQWLLSRSLTNDDWRAVSEFTASDKLDNAASDQWSYWHAISSRHIGQQQLSDSLLEDIANNRSYYGFLAATKLEKAPKINHRELAVSKSQIIELAQNKAAKRALALLELDRFSEARSEWNHFVRTLPKSSYVVAAHLAHQWNWNHQTILAFAMSNQLNDIAKRFPLYEVEQYTKATNTHEIPLSWAYAITRQESAFKKDATSSAGAQGLMQLKPSTARRVARKKLKHTPIAKLSSQAIANKKLLHKPHLNIELGVAHLREMLDYYQGNPILATAAYNAGSGRVDHWLKDNNISDPLTWIEQIPYKETRDYVKNVLTYQVIYAKLTNSETSFISNINNIDIPTNKRSSSQISAR